MALLTQHAPGTFCWPEITAVDQNEAKKFYSTLFGWTYNDTPMGPDAGVYTIFQKDGKDCAALTQMSQPMRGQGVPPHWGSYVAVADVDESTKKAVTLGATAMMEPFDVMQSGRMSVLRDPAGAVISLWQGRDTIGVQILDEPGALAWTELLTTDTDKALAFYSKLFNWKIAEMTMGPMTYTIFKRPDGAQAGGMMAAPAEMQMPSNWLSYIQVENCDATVAKAKELGGKVFVEPNDVPAVGRFAVLADSQGAMFGVYQPEKR
jgi:hypothetical protein